MNYKIWLKLLLISISIVCILVLLLYKGAKWKHVSWKYIVLILFVIAITFNILDIIRLLGE